MIIGERNGSTLDEIFEKVNAPSCIFYLCVATGYRYGAVLTRQANLGEAVVQPNVID